MIVYKMCQLQECKSICIYELDDFSTKVYIHYDKCYTPIWIEYVKHGESVGSYFKGKENLGKIKILQRPTIFNRLELEK